MNNEPKVKVLTWKEAREVISAVNPSLAEQIDQVDPSDEFKLIKATYRFGDTILDRGKLYLPTEEGVVDVRDDEVDAEIQEALISSVTMPMGVVLNKTLELDLTLQDRLLPFGFMKSGHIFALWAALQGKEKLEHKGYLWKITAGIKSVAMLPKISDIDKFKRIQSKYSLASKKPENFLAQQQVFNELSRQGESEHGWACTVIFFSKNWIEQLYDSAWSSLRSYLYEIAWHSSGFLREQVIFEADFARMLLCKNLKPSPYLADTVKHLYALAAGYYPGFKFADDNESLPLDYLQKIFIEIYGVNYIPSILQLGYASHGNILEPIYYCLEWPIAMAFSPKSDRQATKLSELRDIKHILDVTLAEILENTLGVTTESKIYNIIKKIDFGLYHSSYDKFNVIDNSKIIAERDNVLLKEQKKYSLPFCESSRLIRGCIRIGSK